MGRFARPAVLLLLALSIAACRPARPVPPFQDRAGTGPFPAAPLSVRVTFREAALPGARVSWYRAEAVAGGAPAYSGVTDGDGRFGAALDPGRYFLAAEWRKDDDYARPIAPGDRYAWFGGNPVFAVSGPPREIFLGLEEFVAPPGAASAPAKGTGVAGVVLADGAPQGDVHVFAYLRPDGGFRDMGFAASAPTDDNGEFLLELPPGRYYIVARKRAAGGVAGPLRKGDSFGCYAANPVEVAAGGIVRIAIPVTRLKLRNAPSYAADSAAAAFIEGRVTDRSGKAREGVYAALYDNPELLDRPVFMSDVTGGDGRYRLPVPRPGRYYLGARTGYGGSPVPGDLYGRYEGNPAHAVDVRDGERLTGMDIVVEPVR